MINRRTRRRGPTARTYFLRGAGVISGGPSAVMMQTFQRESSKGDLSGQGEAGWDRFFRRSVSPKALVSQATLSGPTVTNNTFKFTISQVSGLNYIVQANTNLSTSTNL